MKSIRHESTEQQQHLFSIAAIMAHKSAVVGQQQQKQLHGKTICVFRLRPLLSADTSLWYFWDIWTKWTQTEWYDPHWPAMARIFDRGKQQLAVLEIGFFYVLSFR